MIFSDLIFVWMLQDSRWVSECRAMLQV